MSIFVGRLARTIAISSKELPRVITLTKSATLELKSGVDKGISIKLDYYNMYQTIFLFNTNTILNVRSKI